MNGPAVLLALETATMWSSASLFRGTSLIAETGTLIRRDHSGPLVSRIEYIVRDSGFRMEDIKAVAVSGGPGSFTGLRVGIGFAKGFIEGTDRKLYAVSTLETIAAGFMFCTVPICSLLDARKGEVYAAVYRWDGSMLDTLLAPVSLPPDNFLDTVEADTVCLFAGDGSVTYRRLIADRMGEAARFAPGSAGVPRASVMGHLVSITGDKYLVDDPASFEPSYIRPPEAVVKWKKSV